MDEQKKDKQIKQHRNKNDELKQISNENHTNEQKHILTK